MNLGLPDSSRKISAVIFDMDGVLVDSIPHHLQAWNEAMANHQLPDFNHSLYLSSLGMTNVNLLANYCRHYQISLSSDQLNSILDEKEALFKRNINQGATTTPGVLEWLKFFKQQHLPCSVASSNKMSNIVLILQSLDISDFFATIISGVSLAASKPDPAIFLSASASLGVDPQECLVIEDAPAGIQAARSAGMTCIALATSYPEEHLSRADLVLASLAEMPPENLFT